MTEGNRVISSRSFLCATKVRKCRTDSLGGIIASCFESKIEMHFINLFSFGMQEII